MVLITLIKTKNNHVAFSSTTEVTAKVYVLKTPAERKCSNKAGIFKWHLL